MEAENHGTQTSCPHQDQDVASLSVSMSVYDRVRYIGKGSYACYLLFIIIIFFLVKKYKVGKYKGGDFMNGLGAAKWRKKRHLEGVV